jgi:8-oxo-dGTP pyrophosphatase MutT (NUDIX family)
MAGTIVTPGAIPAASVILLRESPLEVLMILRHEKSSFVPNNWVFPGGAIDPQDGEPGTIDAARNAAVRELWEETSISLDAELVLTSRWVTPAGLPKRFDTFFFLAIAPRHAPVALQEEEAVDSIWIAPATALERNREGDFPMVFPTIRNLEAIAGAVSAAKLIASRRGAHIEPVEPVMVNNRPVMP